MAKGTPVKGRQASPASPAKDGRSPQSKPVTPVKKGVMKKKAVPTTLVKPGSVRPASPKAAKGKPTGAAKVLKGKAAAAAKGEPQQEASKGEKLNIGQFYAISACSLKMEAKELMDRDFELEDPEAKKLWPAFERMAKRNLGNNEKWVPFHTVLGVHEKFVVEEVHHASIGWWGAYERFVAMFIFRSHCKRDLFTEVQMPFLAKKAFWKNLSAGFNENSQMEKEITKFRKTGKPLQTSCFLIIPERLTADDDQNLIKNLMLRTQRLIALADDLWKVVNDKKTTSDQKFETIKEKILGVRNLGDTWVKMLMVVIDIARPDIKLLQDRCEVGIGASDPMRKILEDEGLLKPKVKKEMGPRREKLEGYAVFLSLKQGIAAVKKDNKQLIQVTKGLAGSIDKANAIAEKLAQFANKGITSQEELIVKRKAMFDDKKFKYPKLGLDAKAEELLKREAEEGPSRARADPDEPTPSEALQTLRKRINESSSQSAAHFWKLLGRVEAHGRKHFGHLPLIQAQMKTSKGCITAATLQVQLCEVRQFNNFLAQNLKRKASEVSTESSA